MDVVVRTPNGDAEVSVATADRELTLADLVETVTGSASPAVVYLDGRAVPAVTSIITAGALIGSTISTVDDVDTPPVDGVVELVQVAGVGAGARRWLRPGRYRIGPGRRLNAVELDLAPVDRESFELHVASDGSIDVRSSVPARIDGEVVDTSTRWESGLLDVGGRVFSLDRRDPRSVGAAGHRFVGVAIDGSASFNRPPRLAAPTDFDPLEVPDGGGAVRAARRFPLLTMLAPIPIAVVMATVLGSPTFLLFGLMSPVMAGANWVSERRNRKHELADSSRADRQATDDFTAAVRERHIETRTRLRAAHPDIADAIQLAETASTELWQRRPGHPDVFQLPLGLADLAWAPVLQRSTNALASAQTIVNAAGPTVTVPVVADLLNERGVGVVGSTDFATSAVGALLIEAAVTHGPADLDIVVLSSAERVHQWEWTKWLPHTRVGGDARLFHTDEQVAGWAAAVRRGWERPARPTAPTHVTLVVVDEPAWWRERSAPLRSLFSDPSIPLRFIAMTIDPADVPAVCTTVITERPDGLASVDHLLERRQIDGVIPYRVSEATARTTARRLASLDDPDVPLVSDAALPSSVPMLSLLGLDDPTSDDIVDRWGRRRDRSACVWIGVDERGPLQLDLVEDGPHALIAGTTGAGKSELLRSLVVGLATEMPPDDINFVLVDFKGGSAFDACAALPHTVGLVTDLDEHLAGRVLRCLRAELRHREHVLRDAGASSLDEYQQLTEQPALPRLVLVVDEFASVAAELPEFLPSLVDVAQRGRSLGLHMVLATQRPAGVLDNKIKANTNLRIALRVQDDGDSIDVIGTKDAALLPRRVPGRAFARLGAGELIAFQSAYSTGYSSADDSETHRIEVAPYVVARDLWPLEHRLSRRRDGLDGDGDSDQSEATDLVRLVGAVAGAARELGQSEQRQPYPDPLPDVLEWTGFCAAHPGDAVPFGLLDLPDEQRQTPIWWTPGPSGSLIVYGIAGAGTSSLIVTLALGVAERFSPDDVHMYAIDADTNELAPLDALPHVGAVVRADELDRLARLVAYLSIELERRKAQAMAFGGTGAVVSSEPSIVIMVDNVGTVRERLGERRDLEGVWPELERVIRDGRPLGICAVMTAKQDRAVPSSLAAQLPERLVMRLGDPMAYSSFGLKTSDVPTFVAGRAVRPEDRTELQIVCPPTALARYIAELGAEPARQRPVKRIDALPASIGVDDVVDAAAIGERTMSVPVGLDVRTAEPALSVVPFGENVIVAGAPGTGRSSVLVAFASAALHLDAGLAIFAVAPRGGPLATVDGLDRPLEPKDVSAWVDRIIATTGRRIVLVDDADRVGGPSFERLAGVRDDDLIVVVAGRADDLRTPAHWTRPLQRFRHAVLLRPEPSDGDLVRVSLGVRVSNSAPHRGVLVVDGDTSPLLAAITRRPTGNRPS